MSGSGAADAVVIGGGVMGLFTALHLRRQGVARVVLLERRCVGAGSSGKSGAILRQHYSHETTVRMSRQSLQEYAGFLEQHGCDIGFVRTPMIFVCDGRDRPALEANVALQRRLGVQTDVLDAAALRQAEPRARFDDTVVAAYEPEAGFVDPTRTLAAVASLCREAGVEIREGEAVTDVPVAAGRATGVRTSAGASIDSGVVINAGGPWAGLLCRRMGIDLPLTAIRPEQAYFVPPPSHGPERYIFGDLLTGLYWKPEPAGWTRVGKMAYDGDVEVPDPDRYDEGVSSAFIEFCRQRMARRLPAYRDAVSWGGCGALYTITPDAHALIGPVPGLRGFIVVSGFSGHGFKMGPAVGRGVAALVTGADPGPMDPAFFAPDRFATGRAIASAYEYGILG